MTVWPRCWAAQQRAGGNQVETTRPGQYTHQHTSTQPWSTKRLRYMMVYEYIYVHSRANQNLQLCQLSCFGPNHPLPQSSPSAPTPWQGLGFCPNLYPHSTAWHIRPIRRALQVQQLSHPHFTQCYDWGGPPFSSMIVYQNPNFWWWFLAIAMFEYRWGTI